MSYIDKVNQVLADRGYNPNARLADYRDPTGNKSYVAKPVSGNFVGGVAKSLGGAANFAGKAAYGVAEGFGKGVGAWGHNLIGEVKILQKGQQMNAQVARGKVLQDQFKAGKISAAQFQKEYSRLLAENKKTVAEKKDIKNKQLSTMDLAKASGETALNVSALVMSAGAGQATLSKLAGSSNKVISTAGKGAEFLGRAGGMDTSKTAAGALIKSQLVAKPSIMSVPQIAQDVAKGNYVGAAGNAALQLSGGLKNGPVGALMGGAKKLGEGISKRIYDTHGLYDVVTLKGGKTVNQAMDAFSATNPKVAKSFEKTLKVFQDLATQEHGQGAESVAKAIEAYQPTGKKFADMSYDEFLKAANSIVKDRSSLQKIASKAGLTIPDGTAVVAARLTPEMKAGIAKRLAEADDPAKEFLKLKEEGILKGPNLPGQIEDMINSGARGDMLKKQIGSLKSVQPALVNGKMVTTKDGRFLAFAKGAGTVRKADQVADIVKGKKATFGVVGRGLEKVGISTKQANPAEQKAIFNKVKDNFIKTIDANTDIKMPGRDILSQLNKLTDQKKGVFDIRQLTKGEIAEAMGSDKKAAGQVLDAYNQAFKKLSYKDRGLAGKLTDFNMRNNPVAPGYARIQSIARYEMNPSFRLQENIETRLGAGALTGKNTMPFTDKYNDTVKMLRDEGVFKSMFAGPAGESAAGLGAISAKLSKSQQNQLAMTLETMAGGKKNVMKFVTDPKNADIMQDIKTIVQYPDKGFTSSNFMKALNLAAFPMRYNLKVTQFAAKALAKQPGAVQVQVLKGIKDFTDWQKTPEGIKWNSDNAEVLGILRYYTPIGSIEAVGKLLNPSGIRGLKDLGQIGGLPFGVISNVIRGQGITKSPSPYLNPKTGEVVPEKVPQDTKARLEQALSDIVGSMFTYPGRIVGGENVPSKTQISQGIATGLTLGSLKGGKYESVTRTDLTDKQKKTQAVLRAGQKSSLPKTSPMAKNRFVDISSGKPVTITPIYKPGKPKRAKAKATPPGQFRP